MPSNFCNSIILLLWLFTFLIHLRIIQIFTFYVRPAVNVFQNFSFTMHILLHHAVNECNILQNFEIRIFHFTFAEAVQTVPSVQMNTEQGSSHSVISSTNTARCQQTCPHMSSLYFSTRKGTINESSCTSRSQTQTSHQNVMLNIILEKIFNPPRLGF